MLLHAGAGAMAGAFRLYLRFPVSCEAPGAFQGSLRDLRNDTRLLTPCCRWPGATPRSPGDEIQETVPLLTLRSPTYAPKGHAEEGVTPPGAIPGLFAYRKRC